MDLTTRSIIFLVYYIAGLCFSAMLAVIPAICFNMGWSYQYRKDWPLDVSIGGSSYAMMLFIILGVFTLSFVAVAGGCLATAAFGRSK